MEKWEEIKVLYVEDDENTRNSLERFLRRRFGKTFTATDGEQGLEIFEDQNPDICIVDILLPGINGLDMIKKMQEINPKCKYIITSTVKDIQTILAAVDLKIESYIIKPLDTTELEEKLKAVSDNILKERNSGNKVNLFLKLEKKKTIEEELRKEIVALVKKTSGRGPRDMVVFINEDRIDINIYGSFTVLERSLLNDIRNFGHVEEGRKLYYKHISSDIVSMIKNRTGIMTHLTDVQINCSKDKEKLTFIIES